jgi:DNA-directed RNA polymerase subunit L
MIISKTSSPCVFHVTDGNLAILNAIRRVILSEIPNLALDPHTALVKTNTSNLNNEFLLQRASLVPIFFHSNDVEKVQSYKFFISAKNTSDLPMPITSQHIDVVDANNNPISDEERDNMFPCNAITQDYVLITTLMPYVYNNDEGQEVDIEMKAAVGIAKQNARWSPVSKCSFMNCIDQAKTAKEREHAPDKKIFDLHTRYRHFITDEWDEPCEFEFYIESECAMTPTYLIETALAILKNKIDNMEGNATVLRIDNAMAEIEVANEDFTLLNLFQSLIYHIDIRKYTNNIDNPIDYIGYYQPHPLETRMILKIHFTDPDVTKLDVLAYLKACVEQITCVLQSVALV